MARTLEHTPQLTIILPHLRTAENDKALRIALNCIVDNTDMDYELLIEAVSTPRNIYPAVNGMIDRAAGEWIVKTNSDVFFAPGWLPPMWEARDPDTIVAGVLVEPGAIGVSTQNVHLSFGMRPETFQRPEFEAWVKATDAFPHGRGWIWPSLHHKPTFQAMGGYDSAHIQWPDPVDLDYWKRWEQVGKHFKRVRSYAYHLQNYSNPDEQAKEVRQR